MNIKKYRNYSHGLFEVEEEIGNEYVKFEDVLDLVIGMSDQSCGCYNVLSRKEAKECIDALP